MEVMDRERIRLVAQGHVQGVGFRPFVFTLAEELGLSGFVHNSPRGVVIEIQGKRTALEAFVRDLQLRLPVLAHITRLDQEKLEPLPEEPAFAIAPSTSGSTHAVLVSPDTCTCGDCFAENADPQNRRYHYPFTNCTNCGPRYTITRSIPYDRATTSMACFPLCPDCQAEYGDPRNRRFHAQPNACPVCGPRVWFVRKEADRGPGGDGKKNSLQQTSIATRAPAWRNEAMVDSSPGKTRQPCVPPAVDTSGQQPGAHFSPCLRKQEDCTGDAALRSLAEFLVKGGIAALKGLGGFHLACDACNDAAVQTLRDRKNRPHKPFAVMAANLEEARRFARIGQEEESLLLSPEHPIVLCALRKTPPEQLSPGISPDTSSVGVMLPYTPLHATLFEHLTACLRDRGTDQPAVLVMTSGNPGGEPICLGNREALTALGSMADAFLFHNRDILVRVDDSVVRSLPGQGVLFFRRARGYVPRPIPLDAGPSAQPDSEAAPCVLGSGAELKNTLCLTKDGNAFVGQHIGDMSNLETAVFHEEIREHLAALLQVTPEAVVRDLHPDYLASRMAGEFAAHRKLPLFLLQHHFAHAHAVLAEHQFQGKALVWALDGTGLGEDGALWGGELLYVDTRGPEQRRLAHFAPMDLPGGEAAIREPWRIAHALLLRLGLYPDETSPLPLPWLPEHTSTADLLPALLARRINTPTSTSCGRLFDAVAALLGLCSTTTYEGQAAIRLEEACNKACNKAGDMSESQDRAFYPCASVPGKTGCLQLDSHGLFRAVYADRARGLDPSCIALRFHRSLARGLADLAAREATRLGLRHVGLSGGCLQNLPLVLGLVADLEQRGLIPLLHKELPPGDGCISLGQAAWGRMVLRLRTQERETQERESVFLSGIALTR